jgi:hypothetical protein
MKKRRKGRREERKRNGPFIMHPAPLERKNRGLYLNV